MELDNLFRLILVLIPILLSYNVYVLRSMRNELRALNTEMTGVTVWSRLHEKDDDRRHAEAQSGIQRIDDRLDRLHGNAGKWG